MHPNTKVDHIVDILQLGHVGTHSPFRSWLPPMLAHLCALETHSFSL